MGATATPEKSEQQPVRVDVMLDDVGDALKAEEQRQSEEADAAKKKKEREDAAAERDADPRVKALEQALRISEESRKRTEMFAAPPTERREEVVAPKELSREELEELHKTNPLGAIEYMQTKAIRVAEENLARRLGPLSAGAATSARQLAEQKYPDEFQILRDDIDTVLKNPAVDQNAMGNAKAWDDLISYVRGKPGNFEKMLDHRASKKQEVERTAAREHEVAAAGVHTRSEVRSPPPAKGSSLDATEREIAKAMGMTDSDYIKWRNIGNG